MSMNDFQYHAESDPEAVSNADPGDENDFVPVSDEEMEEYLWFPEDHEELRVSDLLPREEF